MSHFFSVLKITQIKKIITSPVKKILFFIWCHLFYDYSTWERNMTISIPLIRRSEIGVRFHLSLVRKGPYLLFIIRNNSQDIGITDIRFREWRDWHTKWGLYHTEIPYSDRDNYSQSVTYIPSEALNSLGRSPNA